MKTIADIEDQERGANDPVSIAEENILQIKDKRQKLNFLLLLYGLSLTNDNKALFDYAVQRCRTNIGLYPKSYEEARLRTGIVVRGLLEFVLMACVAICDVK